MLKMKPQCERCQASTPQKGVAFICSFECTFCEDCTKQMNATCPNCNGNLVLRPTRTKKPTSVATSLIRRKLFGS